MNKKIKYLVLVGSRASALSSFQINSHANRIVVLCFASECALCDESECDHGERVDAAISVICITITFRSLVRSKVE